MWNHGNQCPQAIADVMHSMCSYCKYERYSMVVDVDLVGYFLKLNCSTQVWTILFGIEYKYDIIRVKRLDTCSHAKTKSCVMFG